MVGTGSYKSSALTEKTSYLTSVSILPLFRREQSFRLVARCGLHVLANEL